MKFCSGCNKDKSLENFSKCSSSKDGLQYHCKDCKREYKEKNRKRIKEKNSEYYLKNKEVIDIKNNEYNNTHKEEKRIYDKEYSKKEENKKRKRSVNKTYYEKEKMVFLERNREWRIKNRERANKQNRIQRKKRRSEDPSYKLKELLRNRIYKAIKNKSKRGSAIKDLGCTIEELIKYLESMFYPHPVTGEKMTWENHGCGYKTWQIDHKKALSLFSLENRKEFLKACYFTNLQPLWYEDHIKKTATDLKILLDL